MLTVRVETEAVKDAVRAACRAPSLHNIQPWQWVLEADRLQLFLDESRVLPSDHAGREATIGCGAALDHLRVAMAATGLHANVDRFPNPNNPNHLASIQFDKMSYVTEGHRCRAAAIWVRRSDRLPLAPPPNWVAFEPLLRSRLDEYAVDLDVLPEKSRPRLAYASQFAESLRLYDASYHAELHRWTTPFQTSTGVSYSSLPSDAEGGRVDVGRAFPGVHHGDRRTQIQRDQATIVVLSTRSDARADALLVGEALSAVLLECTMSGLATCPLTHLTEVQVTRDIVETLVGRNAFPQILVRIGQAPGTEEPLPRTRRRPLSDVLSIHGG
ncbi:Acg family FMN-binding oxidoreductase [Mycolicibacter hiberniae]|uniref:Putative NAD(P)H nitroreductase acg n=1 Tax=Mycolicibacter hiberniae TaxID=29314 RepID=A0A7I7X4V4_9MYCO|nr:NAD(P)H nitroreductase [Mycolicibacter hiberniae]MCV7084832.1 NAD(P)H nitroreductase [Mycolicibacter hiberniae]ORV71468.1 NAD(P)H nitroreductase [Mycolicibacter hiberniae]BBZ23328.1 putative NAD(P)H nitroreductase acg [Mycolicibacter hiberniae]